MRVSLSACVVTFHVMILFSLIPVVSFMQHILPYILIYQNHFLLVFVSLSLSKCQKYREQASVLENQSTGTFVLQVHAKDADEGANGKVKYGLMHRDSTMPAFRIHPDTGRALTGCRVKTCLN